MGFGISSDNRIKASDERQTAGDSSILHRSGAGGYGDGALAVNAGGKNSRVGDVAAPGSSLFKVTGGTANITSSDPEVLRHALSAYANQQEGFTDALAGLADRQERNLAAVLTGNAANQASAQAGQAGLLSQFTDTLGSLTASQQTDGDSDRNKIILYVVLGVLAVVALIFWRRN